MDKNSKGPKILKYFLMVLRVIVFPFCHHHRITIRSSRGGLDRWSMFQIQVDTFWRSVVRIPLGARYWPLLFFFCVFFVQWSMFPLLHFIYTQMYENQ